VLSIGKDGRRTHHGQICVRKNGLRARVDQDPQLGRPLTGSSFGDPAFDTVASHLQPPTTKSLGLDTLTWVQVHEPICVSVSP
jgi:hypothetical protein